MTYHPEAIRNLQGDVQEIPRDVRPLCQNPYNSGNYNGSLGSSVLETKGFQVLEQRVFLAPVP